MEKLAKTITRSTLSAYALRATVSVNVGTIALGDLAKKRYVRKAETEVEEMRRMLMKPT
jgi:hypothetical protein